MDKRTRAATLAVSTMVVMGWGVPGVQAQTSGTSDQGGTTRQQKKAELQKLEQNGYAPGTKDPNYPNDIQNAEKRASGEAPKTTGHGLTRTPTDKVGADKTENR